MPLVLATHHGPFHADDVLAWALIRRFLDADATVVRTRDAVRLAEADIVYDVGGAFDPARLRFDHHQAAYEGPRSSAGMVLDWLIEDGPVAPDLGAHLRRRLVDYVDDVDNGRTAPDPTVPCFAQAVDGFNRGCRTLEEFDAAYLRAGAHALGVVEGLVAAFAEDREAEVLVVDAMRAAEARGTNLLELPHYMPWKTAYYRNGGAEHRTEFVMFPALDGSWRAVAIPPFLGSFDQKVSFPEAWAGLRNAELAAVTGEREAVFCHKNRFIAVFRSRNAAISAMIRASLLRNLG